MGEIVEINDVGINVDGTHGVIGTDNVWGNDIGMRNVDGMDNVIGTRNVETHGRASLPPPSPPQPQPAQPSTANQSSIVNKLSDFGKIVDAEWNKSFEIRNELFLDEYIIMPNHLHAIVVINVENVTDNAIDDGITSAIPYRLPKSVSSFLAGFKSAVNSKIDDYIDANNLNIPKYNRYNHFFQPNYHDHLIRN